MPGDAPPPKSQLGRELNWIESVLGSTLYHGWPIIVIGLLAVYLISRR